MKAPQLLPWYARKAGVSCNRAHGLWERAVRLATDETGWVGTPEYFGACMDIFQRLLDEEKAFHLCTPRVLPLFRTQTNLMRLPLLAMEDLVSALGRITASRLGKPMGILLS
jgi:hypothetical protein